MSFITRGFSGRSGDRDPRLPPGPDTRRGLAGAVGRCRPRRSTPPTGRSRSRTETGTEHKWNWDEMRALGLEDITTDIHCVTHWSKLEMPWRGVPLDKIFENVETEHDFVMAHSLRRVHDQRAARGPARRQELDRVRGRRRTARSRARRPGAPARAAPVLLEERQVDARHHDDADRRPRLLGAERATTCTATRGRRSATGDGASPRAQPGTSRTVVEAAPRPRPRAASNSTCPPGRATTRGRTSTSA